MMVCASRDLRQVRDTQHLSPLPQLLKHAADGRGDGAADADVDFVEYQRGQLADFGQHDLNRETQAGQLAARRDPRHWTQRLLDVRGNLQLDTLEPEAGRLGNGDQGNLESAARPRPPL